MRHLFVLLTVLFLLVSRLSAQTAFQGIITYQLNTSEKNEKEATLKIFFGKNALKLRISEDGVGNIQEVLVLLDSGKVYNLNSADKEYRSHKLAEAIPPTTPEAAKKIAGYTTTPFSLQNNSASSLFTSLFGNHQTILHVSKDLFFPVPDRYFPNPELLVISNNRIVLGATVTYGLNKYPVMESYIPDDSLREKIETLTITAEATEVNEMTLPGEDFKIPRDYKETSYGNYLLDTSATAPDTAALYFDEPAPPPPPKPASPVKKNAPVKKNTPVKKAAKTNDPLQKPGQD